MKSYAASGQTSSCTGYSLSAKLYRLVFTAHARKRMAERGISTREVVEALEAPVQLVYDRLRDVHLALGHNDVAVVYAVRGLIVEIVTVMRRKRLRGTAGQARPATIPSTLLDRVRHG
ncbi:DUF4258 domain-containing protein [Hyperthermus butylicus]|uniref:Uncharacterized protein n=1 Tax=Hyperthermus butylicus (strain DSM 5456 / JCM 9403 / PLM1-5) TaxID=415426 RepID=A2BN12_HYPBU|nr:DUF4258 domain-containing protein [Hyperthermus butylicus]ABM81373.1 hypothetical protein Hbut_1552 [Hyperthermus butylicus DSM 5456]